MRTLVVGDVHGCAAELEAMLGAAHAKDVVLVGDLFTKGPDPVGVWSLLRDERLRSVLGNHDDRLLQYVDGKRSKDRHAKQVVKKLDKADADWLGWLRERPLFADAADATVVHAALHPSGSLDKTTRKMALTMRWYPQDEPVCPFWYQVYRGRRKVVFGHDAMRGLVRVERDGDPVCIGLDTGCCYGGRLSGYLVEEDRILQVQAAKEYWPVS